MATRKLAGIFGMVVLVLLLGLGGPAYAESDLQIGGSASVDLDFSIDIKTVLFLRVGTAGSGNIDTITFDVDVLPGTSVAGTSSGANPVPVRAAGFVPAGTTMTLSANSSAPLNDGSGNTIPFSKISWTGAGDLSGGTFDDSAAQQLNQWTGSGDRNGSYSFSYINDVYYPGGTYSGAVTYTLSSP